MFTSLKNHFLIAMPDLEDPYFFRSVIYLCDHTENGAIGIIINQPLLKLRLSDILEKTQLLSPSLDISDPLILSGGPVQKDRGFILHDKESTWQTTIPVSEQISLTTSPDILHAIAHHQGPAHALIALGFSNWTRGQLEKEMAANHWLYSPADFNLLFNLPIARRWKAAAALIGVVMDKISSDVGHA